MGEVALLVAAGAFAVFVVFTIPVLLQLRDAAKELEFTLRESREAIRRIRELSEKAEVIVDQGRQVVETTQGALSMVSGLLGKSGARTLSRVLVTALEVFPVAMAAVRLFKRNRGGNCNE